MALRTGSLSLRALVLLLVSLRLATAGAAQEREPWVEHPEQAPRQEAAPDPTHAFEFTLSGDGLGFAYRNGLHRGKGYTAFGLFVSEEDDIALHARLMRFGEPSEKAPLGLGIGLGLFGAHVDRDSDELLAITLTGSVDYALEDVLGLAYPLRAGLELGYAPDIATFLDGTRVLDLVARLEGDLSGWATAFVGYRHLEVDIRNGRDARLDTAFEAGVRLGF